MSLTPRVDDRPQSAPGHQGRPPALPAAEVLRRGALDVGRFDQLGAANRSR
jgi:hypothetical protein